MITFLENIDIPIVQENASQSAVQINFTPHLSIPSHYMFTQLNGGIGFKGDHQNSVVLYGGSCSLMLSNESSTSTRALLTNIKRY
jgi:hypothetical protein